MKKILFISLLTASLSVAFTGCLKDKGFDNNKYGINDPDTQPPGVGFPLATRAKNDWGLDVSGSPQTVSGLVYVNLESGKAASSDVHVALTNNTAALLAAYNTANGTSILPLPTALYTVPTALTIGAGSTNTQVNLIVSSTLTLNSSLQYAVGLTISSVDGGYKIAENLKNLFIVFGVKNQYDGKYTMKGQFYHPSNDPAFSPHSLTVEMHSSGPNSVRLYWPLVSGYNTPLTVNGSPACCFASQELSVNITPGTNAAAAQNTAVGATTAYLPMSGYNHPVLGPLTFNNRWDPATKKIYLAFGYNLGPGGTFALGSSRAWIDTFTRTGPR